MMHCFLWIFRATMSGWMCIRTSFVMPSEWMCVWMMTEPHNAVIAQMITNKALFSDLVIIDPLSSLSVLCHWTVSGFSFEAGSSDGKEWNRLQSSSSIQSIWKCNLSTHGPVTVIDLLDEIPNLRSLDVILIIYIQWNPQCREQGTTIELREDYDFCNGE